MPTGFDGGFEWDEAKRSRNIKERGLDFEDAVLIWGRPLLERRSDRGGEERFRALGQMEGRVVAVIWTPRGDKRRIISARVASRGERQDYAAFFAGSQTGEN